MVTDTVLGMITNGTYISGRIHRGVRESIRSDFAVVQILNLHGSARTAPTVQGSSIDKNVFDIQQGVAISLWCRGSLGSSGVFYRDLVGSREYKYSSLLEGALDAKRWNRLEPGSPHFLWIERSGNHIEEFSRFTSLDQIFDYYSVSGKPGDDNLLVSFERYEVISKLRAFQESSRSATGRLTEAARKLVSRRVNYIESAVVPYAYRPFDTRWTYYDPAIWTRALSRLRSHANGQPILLTTKLIKDNAFAHVFVTRGFPDVIFLSNKSSVNCYSFPLGCSAERDLLSQHRDPRVSNLDTSLFTETRNLNWEASEALHWIYAVLHSGEYRRRYFELLQYDFPRVPLRGVPTLIRRLSRLGSELVSLHLMESNQLDDLITTLVGPGDFRIEKVSYSDETVWIDKARTRGFGGVREEVWDSHIGGYQVCHKWLKDRQAKGGKNPRPGRLLTDEDIDHYQKIVVALSETIRIMAEIDEVIEAHGGWPEAFVSLSDKSQIREPDSLLLVAEERSDYGGEGHK